MVAIRLLLPQLLEYHVRLQISHRSSVTQVGRQGGYAAPPVHHHRIGPLVVEFHLLSALGLGINPPCSFSVAAYGPSTFNPLKWVDRRRTYLPPISILLNKH
ncbi:hypothetical protein M407DRAFT_244719 [Tulasnella calospora MUT 4182]|uniref:Uncharacterized protein n=1 Tax=Tulasnella calospora MUT 4182 TaxID=1051891 RepID=A0A0C3LQC1_9AGAM|nr:hypothetical protein M407DRAFT_244719 [Tulasnella calospora MUT 4182]